MQLLFFFIFILTGGVNAVGAAKSPVTPKNAASQSSAMTAREFIDRALGHLGTESGVKASADELRASLRSELAWAPTDIQLGLGTFETDGLRGPYNEITVTQKLPWTVQRSEIKAQLDARMAMGRMLDDRKTFAIVADLLRAIQRYQHAKDLFHHIEERLELAKTVKLQINARRNVSAADKLERALLSTRIQELELEALDLKLKLQSAAQNLAEFVQTDGPIELRDMTLPYLRWADQLLQVGQERLGLNAELDLEAQSRQISVNHAKWSWLPEFSVYFYQNRQRPLQFEQTQVFGIGFQLPIWGASDRIEAAEKRLLRFESERKIRTAQIDTTMRTFHAELQVYKNHGSVFSVEVMANLERQLADALRAFRIGQLTGSQLLDLEERIHAILIKRQALEVDFLRSVTELSNALRVDLRTEV